MSLRVPSAGHELGATALKAETDKERAYEFLDMNQTGLEFIPIAFDSLGAFAPKRVLQRTWQRRRRILIVVRHLSKDSVI